MIQFTVMVHSNTVQSCTHSFSSAYFTTSNHYPNPSCKGLYCGCIDTNEIECPVCKETYHYKCSDPPITSYYNNSNTWKCSKCKHVSPRSRGRGRLQNRFIYVLAHYLLLLLIYLFITISINAFLLIYNINKIELI